MQQIICDKQQLLTLNNNELIEIISDILEHCIEEIKKLEHQEARAGILNKEYYKSLIVRYEKIEKIIKEKEGNEYENN